MPRLGLLAALVLVPGLVVAVLHRAGAPGEPGLVRTALDGAGRPIASDVVTLPVLPDPAAPLPPATGRVQYRGEVSLAHAGTYHLQLVSDGKATLSLDGRELLVTRGGAREWPIRVRRLSRGRHDLVIEVASGDSRPPSLGFFWRSTADERRPRVPASAFSHGGSPPTAPWERFILSASIAGSAALVAVRACRRSPSAAPMSLVLTGGALLLLQGEVLGDGVGYYAYLRSMALDRDLDFTNDYLHGGPALGTSRVLVARAEHAAAVTGVPVRPGNPWAYGAAILWAPGFLLAHAISALLPARYGLPADGYSSLYTLSVNATNALMGVATLGLVGGRLHRSFATSHAALATLAAFVGTPLLFYTFMSQGLVHAPCALLVTAWLLAWERPPSRRRTILLSALYALAVATYWQLAILLVLPTLEAVAIGLQRSWREARARAAQAVTMAATLPLAMAPQMAIWKVLTGSLLIVPQGNEFLHGPLLPNLALTVVSPYHGMLLWTPVMLISAAGLIACARRSRLAAGCLLLFATMTIHNASLEDWPGGGGFGLRRLSPLVLPFALGLAALLERSPRWRVRILLASALTAFLVLIHRSRSLAFEPGQMYHLSTDMYGRYLRGLARVDLEAEGQRLLFFPVRGAVDCLDLGPLAVGLAWLALLLFVTLLVRLHGAAFAAASRAPATDGGDRPCPPTREGSTNIVGMTTRSSLPRGAVGQEFERLLPRLLSCCQRPMESGS